MSPPVAAAASAALQLLKAEPERVARLQANGALFLEEARAHGLDTVTSRGYAIVPIMVGDIVRAGRITDRMLARGVNVLPIIYPAVPLKAARLRFFVTSEHTPEQIRTAVRIRPGAAQAGLTPAPSGCKSRLPERYPLTERVTLA